MSSLRFYDERIFFAKKLLQPLADDTSQDPAGSLANKAAVMGMANIALNTLMQWLANRLKIEAVPHSVTAVFSENQSLPQHDAAEWQLFSRFIKSNEYQAFWGWYARFHQPESLAHNSADASGIIVSDAACVEPSVSELSELLDAMSALAQSIRPQLDEN